MELGVRGRDLTGYFAGIGLRVDRQWLRGVLLPHFVDIGGPERVERRTLLGDVLGGTQHSQHLPIRVGEAQFGPRKPVGFCLRVEAVANRFESVFRKTLGNLDTSLCLELHPQDEPDEINVAEVCEETILEICKFNESPVDGRGSIGWVHCRRQDQRRCIRRFIPDNVEFEDVVGCEPDSGCLDVARDFNTRRTALCTKRDRGVGCDEEGCRLAT